MFFFFGTDCQEEEPDPELHPLDGWYNNLINPDWGAVGKSVIYKNVIILLSGGIHYNPGPIKYPCTECIKPVTSNQKAIQCTFL